MSKKRSKPASSVEFHVNTDRWIRNLIIFWVFLEALMVFLDYTVNYSNGSSVREIRRLFNITREDGMPSFVGVTQVIFVAVTFWVLWLVQRRQRGGGWKPYGWLVIAIVFTYMAVDDGSRLHERVGTAFRQINQASSAETLADRMLAVFPSYSWQVVYLPFFAAFGLFVIYYLLREFRRVKSRVYVLTAIGLYVGAVGLDFIEGLDPDHPLNLYTAIANTFDMEAFTERQFDESPYDTLVHFSKAVEEFMEMLGTTLLWAATLRHLADLTAEVRVRFHGARTPAKETEAAA